MQHLQLAFVNERPLADDEAKLERLRNFYRGIPPAREEDWRQVLYQAADILDHLGWCRVALERDDEHCAIGAIIAAYNWGDVCDDHANSAFLRDPAVQSIIDKVETHLNRLGKNGKEMCLIEWNDSVAKGRKQVAKLLRATAAHN
jgi:hypothetical protein